MRALSIAVCLLSALSFAQKKEAEPTRKPAPQNVTFGEDDLIEGALQHPIGELYSVPPRGKFASLIQVRMNFNDKLRESVHEM